MKHRKREPGSGVFSSRSNISRKTQGRIPKVPNFPALRNQRNTDQADPQSKLVLPQHSAFSSALQPVAPAVPTTQSKRASERNHRSPSYYGFDNSSSDSTIAAPPNRPRRAGDIENLQHPSVSVVETVQTTAI